jgi:hypothetical protein
LELKAAPWFDALRSDPRYTALIERALKKKMAAEADRSRETIEGFGGGSDRKGCGRARKSRRRR